MVVSRVTQNESDAVIQLKPGGRGLRRLEFCRYFVQVRRIGWKVLGSDGIKPWGDLKFLTGLSEKKGTGSSCVVSWLQRAAVVAADTHQHIYYGGCGATLDGASGMRSSPLSVLT